MSASRPARWLRVLAAATLALVPLLVPATASASCLAPPPGDDPWAAADAVFLGTVTNVANNGRWATVHVEEIWTGPDQPAEVIVRGGPEGATATSVDRTYIAGIRYVFAVLVVEGNLEDNACSATTEADAIDLDAVRPAEVRIPQGADAGSADVTSGGLDLGGYVGPVLLASVIGGLLLASVLLARRREA
jgi:hypothetical protein